MTDEQTPESPGATPEAGATPAPQTPAVEGATPAPEVATPDDEQLGPAGTKAYEAEKKARREAEKRAREAEAQLTALRQAQLSEEERRAERLATLEAEKATWEKERKELQMQQAITALAPRFALIDTEAVYRLLDWSKVDFDDTGRPVNVEEAVQTLVREKPYLTNPGGTPPPAPRIGATDSSTPGAAPRLTAQEMEAARDAGLTPERYAALKSVSTLDQWLATRRS